MENSYLQSKLNIASAQATTAAGSAFNASRRADREAGKRADAEAHVSYLHSRNHHLVNEYNKLVIAFRAIQTELESTRNQRDQSDAKIKEKDADVTRVVNAYARAQCQYAELYNSLQR